MRTQCGVALALLCLVASAAVYAQGAPASLPPPVELRTEYLQDPLGVDAAKPRFSWVLRHHERGQSQAAYQILVSLKPEVKTGDVWDSGRAASDSPVHAVYGGKPLESGRTYYWRVRCWDRSGRVSSYSDTAIFETGLLHPTDWKGIWIGGANQLRKEFTLKGRPVRARAYVSGLGYYELRINGRKVGDHVLDPAWTSYDKRVLYAAYDVTDCLKQGTNAIGVMLGQGWYGSRVLRLQLNIELQGGERSAEVVSDATWRAQSGPVVADSVYDGETYDARLETPGWDEPGFVDKNWIPAAAVDGPKGRMASQMMPPIRVADTITPVKMASPRPGVFVYDLGQNISGWVRLRVRGPRGTEVTMRHAELLYEDGTLNTENLRRARATDVYVLRGDGVEEVYEPRFTYHGFRYVELAGYPGTPALDSIQGRVVHTAVTPVGSFASSKPILNDILRLSRWSIRTNLHSIPTDCDQRDERMGWMADAHLAAESAIWNYDMAAFYTNFLRGVSDTQGEDGTLTDTVPHSRFGRRPADPAWGSAYPLMVWYMYLYYGDRRILEEHYAGMKAWADYLRSRASDGIVDYYYYGDWVSLARTPGSLVSTFYYCWSVDTVARAAAVLGESGDAQTYMQLGAAIRQAFHRRFFNIDTGSYANGSQTSNLLALFLNMTPDELRNAILSDLVGDIVYANNVHLTTGIIGTKYLFPLLTRMNRSDLAYDLAAQTSYPSWGYMLANGATTLWELWQNRTGPSMNSHNHAMFGSIAGWFYSALAGINPDAAAPGFARVRIEPQMVRDLRWASASIETLRGAVASSWSREGGNVRLEVTIPVGSEAEVRIPKLGRSSVTVRESGKPVWAKDAFQPGAAGVTGAKQDDQTVTFQVGSGHYVFETAP